MFFFLSNVVAPPGVRQRPRLLPRPVDYEHACLLFTDESIIKNVYIHKNAVDAQVQTIIANNPAYKPKTLTSWLVKTVMVIDLTTLAGDDTRSNVTRLCVKVKNLKALSSYNSETL